MKKKIILRLFQAVNDRVEGSEFLPGANHQSARDFQDYSELFENVSEHRKPGNIKITTEKCEIHYIGGVLEEPHKIRGLKADKIEIYDNFIDEDFMGSVIYPIISGDNTKIGFK